MVDSGLKNDIGNYKTDRDRRYAFEGYVRGMDEWYWKRTQRLVHEEIEKLSDKTATSLKNNIAVSIGMILVMQMIILPVFRRLHTFP